MHQISSAKNLAGNVRDFREKNKLSLRQLAKISGINAAVLEKIENQTLKKIKFSHLEKL